jgi:hypothetical protein
MIANGQSNKHMAMTLNLSIKTIEEHWANLMGKLGLNNLADVTRLALESGLLEGSAATQTARATAGWILKVRPSSQWWISEFL